MRFNLYERTPFSKLAASYFRSLAPDGMYAGEDINVQINQDPDDAIFYLGQGGYMAGIHKLLKNLSGAVFVTDLIIAGASTTGAASAFSVTFKFKSPTYIFRIEYANATNTGGKITNIKIGGTPLQFNNGVIVVSGTPALPTVAQLGTDDSQMPFHLLVNADQEVEISGTCTTSDAVSVFVYAKDLNFHAM